MINSPNVIALVVAVAVALLTPTLTAIVSLVLLLKRSQARETSKREIIEMYRAERKEYLQGE